MGLAFMGLEIIEFDRGTGSQLGRSFVFKVRFKETAVPIALKLLRRIYRERGGNRWVVTDASCNGDKGIRDQMEREILRVYHLDLTV